MSSTERQRAYVREHYRNNRQYYIDKAQRALERRQAIVNEIKNKPCMDCNIKYPYYVMEFDHREGETKLKEVANLVRHSSMRAILEEIAKCDVVCSNCHRERTHQRRTSARSPIGESI